MKKWTSQGLLFAGSIGIIVFLLLFRFILPDGENFLYRTDWGVLSESLLEDVQVLVLLAGLAFAIRLVRSVEQSGWKVYFGLVAGGLVFLVGEEIAWGQFILGWKTPESFSAVNVQNQTTLHNLGLFQYSKEFLLGFNLLFVAPVLLALALGTLWVFPLLVKRLRFLGPAVPGWGLAPLFFFSASFPVYFAMQQSRLIASYVDLAWLVEVRDWEVGELGMYAGLTLWLMSASVALAARRKG